MSNRCYSCNPRTCSSGFLYVVVDERDGSFKIGCTKNLAKRKSNYRSNGCDFFNFVHSRRGGCEWTALTREAKALRHLKKVACNVRGDWFAGDVEDAIAAVEYACREVKP
ncbi:putative GIY-YIG superfamily endonuclease [Novosphingobium capsulatum]|uniref:GIY-YIG superfamily endonuclease n=1 Tax=Novosphingobium capsulatum TaxID=13688 RepID=A0ABU1MN80_9SPHN|nr:GIY-YIG nuclease family protein [Novosphingobium capsulatum]MDR6511487.1 putative GIY-YIG superfamily endonuclease [Novosphingobium capsulatum]